MHPTLSRLFFLVPLLGAAACGADSTDADLDDADGLWVEIQGYDSWAQPDGWTDTPVGPSGDHGGSYVTAWYDDTLAGWDLSGSAPDGSTSVKESWSAAEGGELTGLTVMQKRDGYDPDNGDWFWAQYDPDGTVGSAGMVGMCSGCHSASSTDYLFPDPPAGG